jgi:hypothetical protein
MARTGWSRPAAAPEHGIRRGWFGREEAPPGVALTFECELGYTFDPAAGARGSRPKRRVVFDDYARDVLRLSARATGQMYVVGLTWDRYVWPLATGDAVNAGRP